MTDRESDYISDAIESGCYSDCCGAEIALGDICMDCREHCDSINYDED